MFERRHQYAIGHIKRVCTISRLAKCFRFIYKLPYGLGLRINITFAHAKTSSSFGTALAETSHLYVVCLRLLISRFLRFATIRNIGTKDALTMTIAILPFAWMVRSITVQVYTLSLSSYTHL